MLKIWGRTNSVNVQKVLWCCAELDLPFERIDAGGAFGRTRDPEYLAMNPNALVPTIEDDGLKLWESNTIVRYLAARHGAGRLSPTDPGDRAACEKWMDWQIATLQPGMTTIFWQYVRMPEDRRDPAAIEDGRQKALAAWRIVDAHLAGRRFLEHERFTIADIPVGAFAFRWFNLPIERPSLPSLEAWYGRLQERDGYRVHVMPPMT